MVNSTKKKDKSPIKLIHAHAAGIDVGSRDHFVAIDSEDPDKVRSFGCTTTDLIAMGNFLKEAKVTTVAMESTGVYWVLIARILEEDFGLEVLLVDPRYVRSVPGRKTDVKDCQWLQRLHSLDEGDVHSSLTSKVKTHVKDRSAACTTNCNKNNNFHATHPRTRTES
jgi:transposase